MTTDSGNRPGAISEPVVRVDAAEKASGEARYLADLPIQALHARIIRSARPRARILSVRYPSLPAGCAIVDARDIPAGGRNAVLMIKPDWPVFADSEVRFAGQTIALAAGPDREALARVVAGTVVEYGDLEPTFTIDDSLALKGGPIHGADNLFADYTVVKGDPDAGFRGTTLVVEEELATGWQEHVYLEPQGCVAVPEAGGVTVHASIQCPFYLRKAVAHATGLAKESVRVVAPVVGGGFGGKEHYPDVLATAAAVAALKLGRAVRLVLDRGEDLQITCKRHPSRVRLRTALDASGRIVAMDIDIRLNAGAYETCSPVVLQRCIFTSTGVYDIPNVRVRGRACATNVVPSDAFRGFGAPQATFAIECHLDHVARRLREDPVAFKRRHFLRTGSRTVTGGTIREPVVLDRMLDRVLEASGYREKAASREPGRGIGVSFVVHGCAFTGSGERDIIKARVGLRGLEDGRVRILAAGVDMGQGLVTVLKKIVARVLDLPLERVLYDAADTTQVPDSGPTIASRSTMIVGRLLQLAAVRLKETWRGATEQVVWQDYQHPEHLAWNPDTLSGDAYPTHGWGVNAVEARVDPVTGEVTVEEAWAVYDVGVPIDRLALEGAVHGGMVQALGWAGLEKLELAADGTFRQGSLADYIIPTSMDVPAIHAGFEENPYPFGPFGAKGAGEIVMNGGAPALAMAVEQAIGRELRELPLTPERILDAAEAAP